MRIGIDARFYGPEGTGLGRYTQKLLENLEKIDKKNDYVVFLRKSNFNLYNPKAKNFRKVLADIGWYSLAEQFKLIPIINREKLDLVHFCHFNVPIFYNKPYVVTIHDLIKHKFGKSSSTTRFLPIFYLKHFFYKFVITHAAKSAVKIIVPSNFTKNEIMEVLKVPSGKIEVTYEAGGEEFKKSQGDSPSISLRTRESKEKSLLEKYKIKKPFIIYVGNVYEHKNIPRLLQALKILNSKKPDLNLVVATARNVFYDRLIYAVVKEGVENNVVMPGFIPTLDLAIIYTQAEAYVFPSLAEGFGIPPLDAMKSGLPVAASNISSIPEILGEAAIYFNPLDPNDIAAKINKILSDDKLRKELISKGMKKASQYSWLSMADQTLKVYEKASS